MVNNLVAITTSTRPLLCWINICRIVITCHTESCTSTQPDYPTSLLPSKQHASRHNNQRRIGSPRCVRNCHNQCVQLWDYVWGGVVVGIQYFNSHRTQESYQDASRSGEWERYRKRIRGQCRGLVSGGNCPKRRGRTSKRRKKRWCIEKDSPVV